MVSLKERVLAQTIASILGTAQRIADQLGPRFARKRAVKIERNLSVQTWDQKITKVDVYTPADMAKPVNGWPVALLVHGGGFSFFSKDSHAVVAARIAEQGYLTIAMDYRLTPAHPFPEGLIDVLSVYEWAYREAKQYGGNFQDLVLVGESAGANFALGLSLIACGYATPPLFPEKLTAFSWVIPKKLVLHCGYLQASGVDESRDLTGVSGIVKSRMRMIERQYLSDHRLSDSGKTLERSLADPLLILEKMAAEGKFLSAEFPEVLIPVGDKDPVFTDSIKLSKVIQKLRGREKFISYANAPHAFYAMNWHAQYESIWKDIQSFLVLPKK